MTFVTNNNNPYLMPSASTTPITNTNELKCLVCDEVDAAKHYGSICCSGCKGFFRRSVRFHKVYECPFGKKCVIKKEFRNCCRACRFNKCLSIGLNPMLVHGDRGISKADLNIKPVKKKKQLSLPDLPISPDLDKSSITSENNDIKFEIKKEIEQFEDEPVYIPQNITNLKLSLPLGHLNIIKCANLEDPREIWKYYGRIEKFIDEFADLHDLNHLSEGFKIELDLSVRDALKSPLSIMNRTKLDWSPKFFIKGSHLKASWGRSIQAYLDWISFIPELERFTDHDRELLTIGRGIPSVWILFTHRSAMNNAPGVLFTGGCYFPRDKNLWDELDNVSKLCGQRVSDIANKEIIDEMRKLQVNTTECALLKLLSFFMVVPNLSLEGISLVQEARRKYTNVLTEYIRQYNPEMKITDVIDRMSRLMLLLPAIERVSQLDDDTMGMMSVFNMADMRCTLTYEMHIRKNENNKTYDITTTILS